MPYVLTPADRAALTEAGQATERALAALRRLNPAALSETEFGLSMLIYQAGTDLARGHSAVTVAAEHTPPLPLVVLGPASEVERFRQEQQLAPAEVIPLSTKGSPILASAVVDAGGTPASPVAIGERLVVLDTWTAIDTEDLDAILSWLAACGVERQEVLR